jgi:hypothetical protein
MKTNPPYVLIAVIFVVVIVYSTFVSSHSVRPHYMNTLFPRSYPYEGFRSHYSPLEYSSNPNQQALDSHTSYLIHNSDVACRKVYGFDGLYCNPETTDNHLDIYSDAQGSLNCTGSGLSNSKGSLCLDKNMTHLLTTRGGNQTTGGPQIGH